MVEAIAKIAEKQEKQEKQWFILWMGTVDDKKLGDILSGFDTELWTPSYSKTLTDGSSEKVPMYPAYHFVRCTSELTYEIEARCSDVGCRSVKFLRDDVSRNPLRVMEDEVTEIQELEKSFMESEEFSVDEEIIICNGPFRDYKGTIREVQNTWLKVEFIFLGTESRTLSIKKEHCQKIK